MNVFGSFSFGNLIKTFLPGFVWLCVFALLEIYLFGEDSWVITQLPRQSTTVHILIFPLAILAGLISNIVVFMNINNWLVRDPFEKNNPGMYNLYKVLCDQWIDRCCARIECDEECRKAYKENIDAELLLLNEIGIEKISYVREQYWYYLEFCMNLMLSLVALLVISVLVSVTTFKMPLLSLPLALSSLFLSAVCILLFVAARKNYYRHVQKMVSLLAAALPAIDDSDTDLNNLALKAK